MCESYWFLDIYMSSIFSLYIDHCVEATEGCGSAPLVYMNGVYASWKGDLNMVLSDINCSVTSKVTVNS